MYKKNRYSYCLFSRALKFGILSFYRYVFIYFI